MILYSTAPGVVEIIDVVSISDSTSAVAWNPPTRPNGIVTGYEVMYAVYKDDSNNSSVPVTGNINSFNMTDLCRLHMYVLEIKYKKGVGITIKSKEASS